MIDTTTNAITTIMTTPSAMMVPIHAAKDHHPGPGTTMMIATTSWPQDYFQYLVSRVQIYQENCVFKFLLVMMPGEKVCLLIVVDDINAHSSCAMLLHTTPPLLKAFHFYNNGLSYQAMASTNLPRDAAMLRNLRLD